jgi:hypothetical protein
MFFVVIILDGVDFNSLDTFDIGKHPIVEFGGGSLGDTEEIFGGELIGGIEFVDTFEEKVPTDTDSQEDNENNSTTGETILTLHRIGTG